MIEETRATSNQSMILKFILVEKRSGECLAVIYKVKLLARFDRDDFVCTVVERLARFYLPDLKRSDSVHGNATMLFERAENEKELRLRESDSRADLLAERPAEFLLCESVIVHKF